MKYLKRLLLPLALLAALTMAFTGCGKKNPGADAPGVDLPEGYEEGGTQEFTALLEDLSGLANIDENNYVRTAGSAEALNKELGRGETGVIRLKTAAADGISIPAGNYTDATVVLNAPNAAAVCAGNMGDLIAEALGEGGLTLKGSVKSLAVTGADITVTLEGGAGHVYVEGKNCTLRLTGGTFGSIVSVNATVVIENATDADVTVYMANGAPQTLKAGETLNFNE